jgi:hypothetical protein
MAARWRAERLFRFFEFLDECSETRGGGREGVVWSLKHFPIANIPTRLRMGSVTVLNYQPFAGTAQKAF